jgi:hypothetical protein
MKVVMGSLDRDTEAYYRLRSRMKDVVATYGHFIEKTGSTYGYLLFFSKKMDDI